MICRKHSSLPPRDDADDPEFDGELAEPPRGQSRSARRVCTHCGHGLGRAITCPMCGFVENEIALEGSSLPQYGADEKHLDPPRRVPEDDPDDPHGG